MVRATSNVEGIVKRLKIYGQSATKLVYINKKVQRLIVLHKRLVGEKGVNIFIY